MIKNKKIAAFILSGMLFCLSGCVFGSNPAVGKDDNAQQAQLTGQTTTETTNPDTPDSDNPDNTETTGEGKDNTTAEPENNDNNQNASNQDENLYILPAMNTDYHAEYDGYVYYREYGKDDFTSPLYLYFSEYNRFAEIEKDHKIYRMDQDGNQEVFVKDDPGIQTICTAGGKLFCQLKIIGSYNPSYNLYYYDLESDEPNVASPLPNLYDIMGHYGDYVFTRVIDEKDQNGDPVYDAFAIFDAVGMKTVGTCFGYYIGADDTGVYTYRSDIDTDNENASLTIYRTDYSGKIETVLDLGAKDFESFYFDWSPAEVTCFQIIDDYIVVNVGCYGGTGHFYQNGDIYAINKKDFSSQKVTASPDSTFMAIKNGENVNVIVTGYDEGVQDYTTRAFTLSGKEETIKGHSIESYQKAFVNYLDDRTIAGVKFNYGDVGIFAKDNGEVYKLLEASEYEKFGFKFGQANEDYDTSNQTEIYDIEYVGDFLYFTITEYKRDDSEDIGWRYAYVPVRTVEFVKDMNTGEIKSLFQY